MKLTQEHIKNLIKEELQLLLEQGKQYYITIPEDGWAILSDENGNEVTNLWTALDHVRDPVGVLGKKKHQYIQYHRLNQYLAGNTFYQNKPPEKSKEWWENVYSFLRTSHDDLQIRGLITKRLTRDEELRFGKHPTLSPDQVKSVAGIFSLFRNIPLENISFVPAALPVGGGESSASSFKPTKPSNKVF